MRAVVQLLGSGQLTVPVFMRPDVERWVAIDVETTGLSPTRDELRELAAVPFGIHADQSEEVLHFTPADFQPTWRPPARARLAALLPLIGNGAVLVAHNAAFDLAFIAEALRRLRLSPFVLRGYCTLRLARALLPDLGNYDLAALQAALGIEGGKPHVALNDARAVAAVFAALVQRAGFADESALRALHGPPLRVGARCASTNPHR